MSDDARRPLTEEERARIQAARLGGGVCAACGRALAEGETVWITSLAVHGEYRGTTHWRVPVGRECAGPDAPREAGGRELERCPDCGRGVVRPPSGRAGLPFCSRACGRRYRYARMREGRTS